MRRTLPVLFGFLLTLSSLSSLSGQVPTSNLVGYWPFTGNANDMSGRGHHGTVYGPSLVNDRFENPSRAYFFDGSLDSIVIPDHADFRFDSSQSFSISLWVKSCYIGAATGGLDEFGLITKAPYVGGGGYYTIYVGPTNSGIPGGFVIAHVGAFGTTSSIRDGKWHHCTVVISDTVKSPYSESRVWIGIYFDGQFERSHYASGANQINPSDRNFNDLLIGDLGVTEKAFKGAIDDVRIYSRALSAAEVSALYTEGGWPRTPDPIDFDLSPRTETTICPGDSVYVDISGNYDTYVWDRLDGVVTDGSPTAVISPKSTTTYRVTGYREVSGFPCADTISESATITITVRDAPELGPKSSEYACYSDSVRLSRSLSGGTAPYSWKWTPSTGLDDAESPTPSLVATESREYQLVVTDAIGCSDTTSVSVVVFPNPTVMIAEDSLNYCVGSSGVEIVAIPPEGGNPPFRFEWSREGGSGVSLDRTDSSHVIATPSTRETYVVKMTDFTGCSGYDTVTVVTVSIPTPEAGNDATICAGESLRLGSAAVDSSLRYSWSPSTDLDDPDAYRPIATPTATTLYHLRVTDPETGCWNEDEILVEVRDIRVEYDGGTIDFGVIDGCRSDSVIPLHLLNHGATPGRIDSVRSDVPGVSLEVVDPDLVPSVDRTFPLRFAPPTAGDYSGRLVIYVGPCGDSIEIAIGGMKEKTTVGLDLSSVDFGLRPTCDDEARDTTLIVTNSGTGKVTLEGVLLSLPYTITSPAFPLTLDPSKQVTIELQYAPSGPGVWNDQLRIPFVAGECIDTLRTQLRGEVEEIQLEGSPASIDFGLLDGCQTERDTLLRLANGSSIETTVTDIDLPTGFLLIDTLPISIPAGGEATVRVRFRPTSIGPAGGMLTVTSMPCSATLDLPVSGEKRGISVTHADTLDFGELILCRDSIRTLSASLLLDTDGTGNGEVSDMVITGPFTTSLQPGTTLVDGEGVEFTVTLRPDGTGRIEGTIELQLQPCDITRRIVLTGSVSDAVVRGEDLDFGVGPVGTSRTDDLLFVNGGTTPVLVDRIDGILPPFRLMQTTPSLPATVLPGDTLFVRVTWDIADGSFTAEARAIVSDPCSMVSTAEIRGEGEGSAFCRIILPQLRGEPGEDLNLTLELAEAVGLEEAGAGKFRGEVAFEASVLVVADDTPWRVQRSERIVEIEGEWQPGSTVIASIPTRATLGRVESTPLRLVSFEWIDAFVAVDTVHGEFILDGLCRDGGVRLFDPTGEIAIRSVLPNPSLNRVAIRYSLSEHGRHRMVLIDPVGRTVRTLFDGEFIPGEYQLDDDLRGIAAGSYHLVLETPSIAVSTVVVVQ